MRNIFRFFTEWRKRRQRKKVVQEKICRVLATERYIDRCVKAGRMPCTDQLRAALGEGIEVLDELMKEAGPMIVTIKRPGIGNNRNN